jgi:RNA polymerase sigma factor FliA
MQDIRRISNKSRQTKSLPHTIATVAAPVTVQEGKGVAAEALMVVQDAAQKDAGRLAATQEQLMIDHLPIVRFIARRIHERLPQHVPLEDLLSAGIVGLMDAFSKFNPEKQVQFRSYAQFRIRGAILDSLRTLDWSPRELRRKGRAVEQAIQTLTARCGRPPSDVEIAAELGMTLADYQNLLGELKGLEIGTLHAERSEDSGEEELAYLPNRPEDDPLFRCLHGEMRQRLADAVSELPERERLVMTLYYYEELTMKEIGLILGVVESRVSQMHASAVLHLRAKLADLTGLPRPNSASKHRFSSPGGQPEGQPSIRKHRSVPNKTFGKGGSDSSPLQK